MTAERVRRTGPVADARRPGARLAAALAVLSFAMTLFLKELPLRSSRKDQSAAPAAEG